MSVWAYNMPHLGALVAHSKNGVGPQHPLGVRFQIVKEDLDGRELRTKLYILYCVCKYSHVRTSFFSFFTRLL